MSKQTNAISISTIGIDIGKNTLHLIGLDERRIIVLREKLCQRRMRGCSTSCATFRKKKRLNCAVHHFTWREGD